MGRYLLKLVAVTALVGTGIFLATRRGQEIPGDATPPTALAEPTADWHETGGGAALPPPPPAEANSPADAKPDESAESRRYARIVVKAGQPIPELFPFEAEREKLHNLAAGDDPARFDLIGRHLNHSDARVREAARLAFIQTGDRAAVPYLEKAAKESTIPEETQLLVEAVEFLSLPKFLDVIAAHARSSRDASGTTPPPAP